MIKTVIIGGGASGMMAAAAAASRGEHVTIIEKNNMAGRKILATGNGRCNFTNMLCRSGSFFCEESGFVGQALQSYTQKETMDFFARLGIHPRQEAEGRVYPYSEQAASVREALLYELNRLRVSVLVNKRALSLTKKGGVFFLTIEDIPGGAAGAEKNRRAGAEKGRRRHEAPADWRPGAQPVLRSGSLAASPQASSTDVLEANRVIIAAGGKAGEQFGCTGDGYRIASAFGHRIVKPLPALVQLTTSDRMVKDVKGVRAKGRVSLLINDREVMSQAGEVQYTAHGLSGICVMDVSRLAVRALERKDKCRLSVDLMPHCTKAELTGLLEKRVLLFPQKTAEEYLNGLVKDKLQAAVLKKAHVALSKQCRLFTASDISGIADALKGLDYEIDGYMGFQEAQVTTGGICLEEVAPVNMESRIVPGLHFCGEVLDVDGICGGFNLQWAWTSGYLAGYNDKSNGSQRKIEKSKGRMSANRAKSRREQHRTKNR